MGYIIHSFNLYFHNGKSDITSELNTEVTFYMICLLKLRNLSTLRALGRGFVIHNWERSSEPSERRACGVAGLYYITCFKLLLHKKY
jgi:hypothetical protein